MLAAINPFEQRVKDLGSNQVSTDVSIITQAGTRWEGDVALTLDNINDVGLIAIYDRHDYITERRTALALWTDFILAREAAGIWVPELGKVASPTASAS